jgi:hypothetical protein
VLADAIGGNSAGSGAVDVALTTGAGAGIGFGGAVDGIVRGVGAMTNVVFGATLVDDDGAVDADALADALPTIDSRAAVSMRSRRHQSAAACSRDTSCADRSVVCTTPLRQCAVAVIAPPSDGSRPLARMH